MLKSIKISPPLTNKLSRAKRHDINKLNFNRSTKFSNLSLEERAALENLSKRKDIIVEAVV